MDGAISMKTEAPFVPTGNKLLAKRIPLDEKTKGGIFIPQIVQRLKENTCSFAEIISIGPGNKDKKGRLKPTEAKPGDKFIFDEFTHLEMKIKGEDYIMMREDEILGIIE
jgi:chaperonin GroES